MAQGLVAQPTHTIGVLARKVTNPSTVTSRPRWRNAPPGAAVESHATTGTGDFELSRPGDSAGWWLTRRSAPYSYRYFSESASACSMSAIVRSGIRSWASVTSAEVGWASAGSHCSGFQAPLRSSDLGQCG